jgi:hypothetical protein
MALYNLSQIILFFTQLQRDLSLHYLSMLIALLIYVDDIVIANNDIGIVSSLTAFLNSQFHLKDLGIVKYFIGLKIYCLDYQGHLCESTKIYY